MKEHHLQLAKYWAATASNFRAAGYHHMAQLFSQYSVDHINKAAEYED